MINVSIIIPIYNVESYIEECLDSVCNQSLENIQIICVDDCSTDSSLAIVKRYQEKHPVIEIYQNNRNRGLAYTRNVGMQYALGEYVMFVDSDDYIAEDACRLLYSEMSERHLDIMPYSVQMFADADSSCQMDWNRRIKKQKYSETSGAKLLCSLIENQEMFGAVWGAIYRREYLVTNNICFIDGILHEDIPFMFEALLNAKKAFCLNEIIYYYRQRANSILSKPDHEKLLGGLIVGYMNMLQSWSVFQGRNRYDNELDVWVERYMLSQVHMIEDKYVRLLMEGNKVTDKVVEHFFKHFDILKREQLNSFFSSQDIERMLSKKKVAIYGAGKNAGRIIILLQKNGIHISNVYVSSLQNNPRKICGIEVETFNENVEAARGQCIVIAVSVAMRDEIIRELRKQDVESYIYTLEEKW